MEKRIQLIDDDALPRAISRFRRCEAVDNAMRRDTAKISADIDPEIAELEDQVRYLPLLTTYYQRMVTFQVIGFLTSSVRSVKLDAFVEKQMVEVEKNKLQVVRFSRKLLKLELYLQARSHSPINCFNRKPNSKSILGNYSIDYNPREFWDKTDEVEHL